MPINRGQYKILVIEDNLGDFALVEDFLFEQIEAPLITEARNFKTAMEFLSAKNCLFDVVLLDLSLPDNTGENLIREIVDKCPNVPVIVLTGYSDFDFGIKSMSLGVSDYLLKDELTPLSLYKSIVYSCERKKYTEDLSESERKYSDLFNFSPLPMWVADIDTLAFLDVNEATINHYGYSREEFLAMTIKDIRPEETIPELQRVMDETRHTPEKISHRQVVHKMKNGDLRNVEVQFSQLLYRGTKANIVIATDITDRLNYIKTIQSHNEKLMEISWMQSHIIRAPLTRILGLIPLITSPLSTPADQEEMLGYLTISANELDEVIRNIVTKAMVNE